MTEQNPLRKTKIFISYSRKNKLFTRKLNKAIDDSGIDCWVDWEGIPLSSDWMAEINAAIEESDAVVFVISPDSLKSKICMNELETAIQYNKKIIPVLYAEPERGKKMHPKLASSNWVYMRPKKDNFKATLPKLIESIQTDLGWIHQHTRLLQRATEWNNKQRNKSYLLQGTDLNDGELWMTESTKDTTRAVVPVQAEYISTSRTTAIKRQRNLTIGIGAALILSVILAIYAFNQTIQARESRDKAEQSQKIAEANENARATQQVIAEEQKILADKNAQQANAQRSASEAKIYQSRVGELHTSTLLALDAYQQMPGLMDAENILRHNINLLPIPIKQINMGARIWTIQTSRNQQKFITADGSGKTCVWNIEDGAQIFCVQQDGIVYDVLTSLDDRILITGTEKGIVAFWDANTGKQIKSIQLEGAIWELAMHPAGKWLGVGRSNAISIIDMSSYSEALSFQQNGEVKAIDFDDAGKYMAMGTADGYVSIWTVMGSETKAGAKHSSAVIDLEFSPNSAWLVSVGEDRTARVTNTLYRGQKYFVTEGDWVEDVTFGPDSSWFVTVSDDNSVRVIDTNSGQERLRMAQANFVQKVRVSSDGQWIATTGYDKTARIWDSANGTEMMQIPLTGIGSSIRFNKDSTRLIVGDYNGNITLWDISQLKARTAVVQFSEFVNEARLSPDGKWMAVNSDDKNIWVINTDQLGKSPDDRKKLMSTSGLTSKMTISADSKWIAVVEKDESIPSYNRVVVTSADGQKTFSIAHDGEVIDSVVFTPDNKQVITADEKGLINIWGMENGKKAYSLDAKGSILSLAASPNGKYLVTGMEEGNHSIVWNLTTKKQTTTLEQIGRIKAVQFSKDGKLLASGSSEATLLLWNAEDETFSRTANSFHVNGEVLSLEFNPKNAQLAAGNSNGYVYIFDLTLGQEITRLPHTEKITSVSFSPSGKQLAAVARNSVSLWDMQSAQFVTRDNLFETACAHLINNFGKNKWKSLFFEEEYRPICPNLPADAN